MIILGINHYFHDCSACLVRDGELLVALEEERFSRAKHTTAFPEKAIERCFEVAGIGPGDVDHVAVSIQPVKHWGKKAAYAVAQGPKAGPFIRHELKGGWRKNRILKAWFDATFTGARKPKLHFIEHHKSHIYGSYYVSPYEHAALLSVDGSGEWSTLMLGEARGMDLTVFSETYFPHSLGSFYEAATQFCGFQPNFDEGKTMGLAPLGDASRFVGQVGEMVAVEDDGRVRLDLSYFAFQNWGYGRLSPKYAATFGPPRDRKGTFEQHHLDLAAAAQRVLEDRVLELCRILEKRTTADHLVIAGGVALNSVMNGRILRETRFKDLYVMPAAGDNGTCIGAAYCVWNGVLGQTKRVHHDHAYLGTGYDNAEIEALLAECKLDYRRSDDVCAETAKILRDGKIVAWFQGRMEIGPRALGNRSILCDPTLPHMKDKINAEVKHREAYRPFAPSALAEVRSDFFEITVEAPFMLKVCDVRPDKRDVLPAITHVDGSARLQTVRAEHNPRYHRLISEFGKLSGVPVLLNTSFNIMGEPIVESPVQAIRCFFSTGLDVLVLGDFIVMK
ncbi:MAG: carbamoyltransferase [Rhodospirillales bacterium]